MFLSDEELQQLTGYQPSQRKKIAAWLKNNSIPFVENRLGQPVVLKRDIENNSSTQSEPHFGWLETA